MRRLRRLLPAIWLVALLATPVALWVLGTRQPLLQNAPKAEFPPINRSSLRDDETFKRIDAALLDRLPLRGDAVDAHATIAIDAFGDTTNPAVVLGDDGWLYYDIELQPCRPGGGPIGSAPDALEVLSRTFVAAGYRTAVTIAGAKQFVHVDPSSRSDPAAWECMRRLERSVDERLARVPGGIDLNGALRAEEERGNTTFLATDTHWNWRGRELFVRRVLDAVRPGLAEETGLSAGATIDWPGNLTMMLGLDRTEPDRGIDIQRPPRRPFRPGEVVLSGDSQLGVSLLNQGAGESIAQRVFPGYTFCSLDEMVDRRCGDAIRAARVFVFEKVSREFSSITLHCWAPVALAAERLPAGRPSAWEAADGSGAPSARLTLPETGSATVRVRPASGDVADVPRLMRLPIRRYVAPLSMAQLPTAGEIAPCATPTAGSPDVEALYLPIPAGRRASELVVRIESAAGTTLGRPQEIGLDGRPLTGASAARRDRR